MTELDHSVGVLNYSRYRELCRARRMDCGS